MNFLKRTVLALILLIIMGLGFYFGYFLRQPARNIPFGEQNFISPANGKIIEIREWKKDEIIIEKGQNGAIKTWTNDIGEEGTVVSIQMTPLDVHFQRMPVTATLRDKKHVKGSFKNAIQNTTRYENEHNILTFETADGIRFKIVQIAGFLARRIEDYVEIGQTYTQGDVIGLIKLGSQVSVVLPTEILPQINMNDVVLDGESIIGHKK